MSAPAVPLDERRLRFYRATLACVEGNGLESTSLEDVARAAGSSRATLYRAFPGGREQLVTETVAWEVTAFFARIAEQVEAQPDLHTKVATAVVFGHHAIAEHALLQRLLRTEPEALLSELQATDGMILGAITAYLVELLDAARREGVVRADCDVPEAADHLARLFLSYLGSPGRWDLDDPGQVDELVRTQFLAGIVA